MLFGFMSIHKGLYGSIRGQINDFGEILGNGEGPLLGSRGDEMT